VKAYYRRWLLGILFSIANQYHIVAIYCFSNTIELQSITLIY
jgi:hypothetical protein